jgi:hypothetical protein
MRALLVRAARNPYGRTSVIGGYVTHHIFEFRQAEETR